MKRTYKIILTVFATIIFLIGVYVDVPEFIYKKIIDIDVYQAKYFNSLTISQDLEKIILKREDDDAIYNFQFRFKYHDGGQLYPNLFQTSNFNKGLRMEFGPDMAALIYNCSKTCKPNGYNVIVLSKYINFSSDNYVDINLKQGKYIKVKVNSGPEMVIRRPPPNIELDNILVGSGFDNTRSFSGEIGVFNLTVSSDKKNYLNTFYFWILLIIYFILIIYLKKIPTK